MNFTKLFVGAFALTAMLVACGDDSTSAKDTDRSEEVYSDLRDGQTYKTVTIGDQVWMAENLNYAYTDVPYEYNGYTSDSTSWCYNNDPSNCSKYGRLYTWVAATTVCPSGWHLPSTTEWKTLFTAVGGQSTAGKVLKSQTGWTAYDGITNEDAFGFSALPAGCKYSLGDYDYEGSQAYFWSSSEDGSDYAYNMLLDYYGDNVRLLNTSKSLGFSVRCLKD